MNLKLGSHVSMSGKSMLLGSAKEAESYGANTFMFYTGAPQNTKRKEISELNIDAAWNYMNEKNISDIVVHAPYIINLGNTVKPETYKLAVGAGVETGLQQVIKGLNEVLTKDTPLHIALETMAGKGSELGRSFEELAAIYDGVVYSDKLRVCFDTCHTHDSGYDIRGNFDGVIDEFDHLIGKDQIAVFHINDSKNVCGAKKDRHANLGTGEIGFDALSYIVHHPDFEQIPKILETPYIPSPTKEKKSYAPYKYEIAMLRASQFDKNFPDNIIAENEH